MNRRTILTNALAVVTLGLWSWLTADAVRGESGNVATLEEQLKSGLKARRQREFAFIRNVVQLVEDGKLPEKLVKSTFSWARKQGDRRYPYIYFNRALKLQAQKLGVNLNG